MRSDKNIQNIFHDLTLMLFIIGLCVSCTLDLPTGEDEKVSSFEEKNLFSESDLDKYTVEESSLAEEVAELKVNEIELECGSYIEEQFRKCLIEDKENSYISSAEIIHEYSDNICEEGRSWKVGDELDSIETWGGCDASFIVETTVKESEENIEAIQPGKIQFIDTEELEQQKLEVGDYVGFDNYAYNDGVNSILVNLDEDDIAVRVELTGRPDVDQRNKIENEIWHLNHKMEIQKTIVFKENSKMLNINNIKDTAYLLVKSERKVLKVTHIKNSGGSHES